MKKLILALLVSFTGTAANAAHSVSLNDYLISVDADNLQLKASHASVEAASARSVGIQIPEPMVGYMRMSDSSGAANGIEVFQTIPFPLRLSHDRSARRFEAAAIKSSDQETRSETLAQGRLIYFNVWAAQSRIQFLEEKRAVTQEHLRLSTASSRSDSSLRIHSLKAESDFDSTENDIIEAEQSLREKLILMASFINQDPDNFAAIVSEPPMALAPEKSESPPKLEFKRLNLGMFVEKEYEAKNSWFPDLSLRFRDIGNTPMTPGYREIMIGATLPFVFFWQPNEKMKAASAEKLRAEAEYQQEKINLKSKTLALTSRIESLKKQINLIQTKLLPRAEKRMRLINNLAPRDMESLREHREGMETFPDLKLESLGLRIQYEESVAELYALISEGKSN